MDETLEKQLVNAKCVRDVMAQVAVRLTQTAC
jgi:hypothetical protein